MSRETEIVAYLKGDTALMAILLGGVYAYTEIRRLGLSRKGTPAAFDADDFLLPCCVVKGRGPVFDPNIYDLKQQVVARRQYMEMWVYEDTEYTAIDAAAERIYQLLQGHPFSSAWPASWSYTTQPLIDDGSVKGASLKRMDYLIVDLAKGVAV